MQYQNETPIGQKQNSARCPIYPKSEDPNLKSLQTPEQAERMKIVLCQPAGSRNVGSVCRAMGSMGFSKLYIVGRKKEFFNRQEVCSMGLDSAHIFDEAGFENCVKDITNNCSLVVGLTRRCGSRRKYFSIIPEQLCHQIVQTAGPIALLFGNERVGLNDEELGYCNLACHIPTHPQQPSLNLSHAVQIILYEISKLQEYKSGLIPLSQQELRQLSLELTQHMHAMGLKDRLGNQRTQTFLHDIFSRATLSKRESQRLLRMFQTIRYHKTSSS